MENIQYKIYNIQSTTSAAKRFEATIVEYPKRAAEAKQWPPSRTAARPLNADCRLQIAE
ncbi:MAG: hypothetical protein GY866_36300 [Proteobacteria bacterium]|nr:hypothetical protein [Pseudomonadota bacterium]